MKKKTYLPPKLLTNIQTICLPYLARNFYPLQDMKELSPKIKILVLVLDEAK